MQCAVCGSIEGPWYITNDLQEICDLCIDSAAAAICADKVDMIDLLEQSSNAVNIIDFACRGIRRSA